MVKRLTYVFVLLCVLGSAQCNLLRAQFDPRVDAGGVEAIHKDDSRIQFWAVQCTAERGWQNIADTGLGKATSGETDFALGKANGIEVISLGDGGVATLSFPDIISNGTGPDFAVFENSFDGFFLELAFVEVSSDGQRFVRFPAIYNGKSTVQNHDTTHADSIYNLAGKYIGGYGTPFDLEELKDSSDLDIDSVTHIRLVDVVGSVHPSFASLDSKGNTINEAYPTPFPTGGFDLDAVGVLNSGNPTGISMYGDPDQFKLFPNPAKRGEKVNILPSSGVATSKYMLYDSQGRLKGVFQQEISTSELTSGIYLIVSDQYKARLMIRE